MSDGEKWIAEQPDYVVVEKYRDPDTEPDPHLRGNPMAMVFPPPIDDNALLRQLTVLPKPFPEGWQGWPRAARVGLLQRITGFHYVFDQDPHLFNRILAVVRESLRLRDPRNPRVMRAIMQLAAGQMASVPRFGSTGGGGGLGILVIGILGVGKSSTVDRVTHLLGNFGRIHTELLGQPVRWPQLGVIRVNVESSWKDTLKNVLVEANRQLGRALHHAPTRATTGELALRVRAALSMGWAPVLILDEIQRLDNLNKAVAKEILNGAIDLMSCDGIPVVLVGNEKVRDLFDLHKSELAKFSNGGEFYFGPLGELQKDTYNFINLLKRYAVSLNPVPFAEDFNHWLWIHCMGVRRIMVECMRVVLARHAEKESIAVDEALLADIAKNELKAFQPALSRMRLMHLGHKLSYSERKEFQEYFEAAFETLEQSKAQMHLQHEWQPPSAQPVEKLMDAQTFVKERRKLQKLEADLRETAVDDDERTVEADDDSPVGGDNKTRTAAEKQIKLRLAKAKAKLEGGGNVVGLDAARRRRNAEDGGIDPSDLR